MPKYYCSTSHLNDHSPALEGDLIPAHVHVFVRVNLSYFIEEILQECVAGVNGGVYGAIGPIRLTPRVAGGQEVRLT